MSALTAEKPGPICAAMVLRVTAIAVEKRRRRRVTARAGAYA
jgi:hypothetical protein